MSERIIIAGWPRAGKTTLASQLNLKNTLENLEVAERPGSERFALFEAKISGLADLGTTIFHTDALIATHDWSAASEKVSTLFDIPGPWIIEGVATCRALRKWLERNPTGSPCDVLYYLDKPFVELTKGQRTMGKGCDTVFGQIQAALLARGVSLGAASRSVTTESGTV